MDSASSFRSASIQNDFNVVNNCFVQCQTQGFKMIVQKPIDAISVGLHLLTGGNGCSS